MNRFCLFACLCSVFFSIHTQDLSIANDAQLSNKFENLTLNDAIYIISHSRCSELFCHKGSELGIIQSLIFKCAEAGDLNLIIDFNTLAMSQKDQVIRNLFKITLYRLIYQTAFSKAMFFDQDSHEILLLKTLTTPQSFQDRYAWMNINSNPIDFHLFPTLIEEKMLHFVKELTFNESIALLIFDGMPKEQKDLTESALEAIWPTLSDEDLISLNTVIRAIVAKQTAPEHQALALLLYSDREWSNWLYNSKLLSSALVVKI